MHRVQKTKRALSLENPKAIVVLELLKSDITKLFSRIPL